MKESRDLVELFYLNEERVDHEVKRDEGNIAKEAIDQVVNLKVDKLLEELSGVKVRSKRIEIKQNAIFSK